MFVPAAAYTRCAASQDVSSPPLSTNPDKEIELYSPDVYSSQSFRGLNEDIRLLVSRVLSSF